MITFIKKDFTNKQINKSTIKQKKMNYLLPLFAVLIGYILALFLKPKSKTSLKLLLAFSGAFLLSLTVMHLLPEVYESHNHNIDLGSMDLGSMNVGPSSLISFSLIFSIQREDSYIQYNSGYMYVTIKVESRSQ